MTNCHMSVTWTTLVTAVFFAPFAIDNHSSNLQAKEAEWISLFDGKTLNGWHTNKEAIGKDTGGHWVVEDGAIAGEQDPPGGGIGGVRAGLAFGSPCSATATTHSAPCLHVGV